MSDTITKPLPYRVDLAEPIKKTYLDTLFATHDNEAHRFEISLYQNKAALKMPSGTAVSAYFIRYSDMVTIPLKGSMSGNVASVTLKEACYNKPGQFALVIKVTTGSPISAVFYGEGTIFVSSTDKILDDENIIPSLDELLAQIDAMEAATNRANTAAARAEALAIDASGYAGDSKKLDGKDSIYYLRPYNLLDNSDFRNPVNQRGTASPVSAAGVYVYDRWRINSGTWEFDEYGLTMTASGNIQQRIPFKSSMNEVAHTLGIYYADGGVTARIYGALPVGSSGEYFYVNITPELNRKVKAFALYEGTYTAENLPPYVPKGYAVELAECQRYYYQSWEGKLEDITAAGVVTAIAMSVSRLTNIQLPQTMIATPDITFYTSGGVAGNWKNWVSDELVEVTQLYANNKSFIIAPIGINTVTFTQGATYAGHSSASADL